MSMGRVLLLLCLLLAAPAEARSFTDAAGRTVEIPDRIERIFAAGPPAQVLVYVLAPDKLLGWARPVSAEERPFIAPAQRDLPATGRLAGRGSTANLEDVLALRPDLIVDVGSTDPTYASMAERVQSQTGIPYVLLDGAFARTPQLLREAGELFGTAERGRTLAAYAEAVQADVRTALAAVPEARRPRAFFARGPKGLQTGLKGSINVEILETLGARNVAAEAGTGSITDVSLEQVLKWDPEVIVTQDPAFAASVRNDPLWQGISAVRGRRVLLAPTLPFGWLDGPPGVNRLIGARWLGAKLYPQVFDQDLRKVTREFYALFYGVDLFSADLNRLLNR